MDAKYDDTAFNWRDYVKLKSVTWWSGLLAIVVGMAQMIHDDVPWLGAVAEFVAAVAGSTADPVQMILIGTGLIGIRAKLGRV